eukprot:g24202.t1
MEGVINSTIKQHLLSNNLLSDAQFGFCLDHLDPDFITTLVQTWMKVLNSRGEVRVTALDIKTTFNQVWYQGAPAKLETMGIREQGGPLVAVIPITIQVVTIDQKFNWACHINTMATRTGQGLGML